MNRFIITLIVALVTVTGCVPTPEVRTGPAATRTDRDSDGGRAIEAILARPELAQTHVGICVRSLDRDEWLYERSADKLFVPASNAKVLVAVAALRVLRPACTFATTLATTGQQNGPVLAGDLILTGGGNPDLTTGDVANFAERLRALGVTRVTGNLVLDGSAFDSVAYGPGWMWDEGPYSYNAPVSAFMLNRNTVRLTVRSAEAVGDTVRVAASPPSCGIPLIVEAITRADTVPGRRLAVDRPGEAFLVGGSMIAGSRSITVVRTVPDPAAYAGAVFVAELERVGIAVEGETITGVAPGDAVMLATSRSAPVDVLVRRFLKESDNLIGETLVKQMGRAMEGAGSWSAGLSAVRRALHEYAGLDSTTYRLADGSGLSRYTELSPRMLVQVIAAAWSDFTCSAEFLSALAVGGTDGTLARRLGHREVAGYVRAKTGTMSGVASLSGVTITRSGERLAFSIMMNGFVGSSRSLGGAQEEIVTTLRTLPFPPVGGEMGEP